MNRIRAIAVVLSMVLFLMGAAGNTEDKTENAGASYEGPYAEITEITEITEIIETTESMEETEAELEEGMEEAETSEPPVKPQAESAARKNSRSEPETDRAEAKLHVSVSIPEPEVIVEAEEETEEETEEERIETSDSQPKERMIPVSQEDYTALLKLVEAEASGEDLKGKMLVANVVLNRLQDGAFGSTVKEVIYQRVNGKAQFSPVASGKIEKVVVSEETVEAVERVLCGADESQGALYFVARAYADPDNMAWFDRNLTWLFQYHGHEFFA